MQLHIEALFTQDPQGRMLRINEPAGGGPAPRFFLGRTPTGHLLRFRADVDQCRQRELEDAAMQLGAESAGSDPLRTPLDPSLFRAILEREAPVTVIERGPAFVCPDGLPDACATVSITADTAGVSAAGLTRARRFCTPCDSASTRASSVVRAPFRS